MTLVFEKWSEVSSRKTDRKWSKSLTRGIKITAAASLLVAGGYAMLSERGYVVSENAVVSAYVTSLRMPIEGFISDINAGVGTSVEQGGALARVQNPRVDDQLLFNLRSQLKRLTSERAAVQAERVGLEQLRLQLEARSRDHAQASVNRIAALVEEAERTLAARVARRDQLQRDLTRKQSLAVSGAVSQSDLDRIRGEVDVVSREIDAQRAHTASLRTAASAVSRGVIAETGSNDVAYSAQRADEIAIRLVSLNRTASTLEAEAEETAERLAAEERRIALMTADNLKAPSSGMVWKLGTSNGERLGVGDTAAELVDCGSAFIVASIPQDRVPDVAIGSEARFRLSGEREDRLGLVLSVTGDAATSNDRNLAAVPLKTAVSMATVRVAAPSSHNVAGECLVGRTARVLLPVARGGLAGSLDKGSGSFLNGSLVNSLGDFLRRLS
jgi:multidrug resistance efflux pump